jgi:hypothetical protein
MAAMFDLNLIPIARQAGRDQPSVMGLLTAQPPRRSARGRESDRLILYLSLAGSAPLTADQNQDLLQTLSETYFKMSGAVTAAMRSVAESLNTYILERNLRSSNTGRQSAAWLTQVVMRGETLSLAHSGPVHSYVAGGREAAHHYYDPENAGRGLGLSRQVNIRYFQAVVQPGLMLVLSHQPATMWTSEGMAAASQTPDTLRRLLVSAPDPNLSAVVLIPQPGSGKITVFRSRQARTPASDMAEPSFPPSPAMTTQAGVMQEGARQQKPEAIAEEVESSVEPGEPTETVLPTVVVESSMTEPAPESVVENRANEPIQEQILPPVAGPALIQAGQAAPSAQPSQPMTRPRPVTTSKPQQPQSASLKKIGATILRAWQAFGAAANLFLHQAGRGLHTLLRRVMPDSTMLDLPPTTLIFIAVAIPVVVSVVAAVVYLERGKGLQHQAYLDQAAIIAEEARTATDPAAQRSGWNEVLTQIDLAEQFRVSNESQQLRLQAYTVLDDLDQVSRLNYQPAIIGGLDNSVRVVHMLAVGADLFLLDGTSGQVLRAILTGGGYQLDNNFACGPLSGPISAGPVIDIAVSSATLGQAQSSILAIDGNGVLLTCVPGELPLVQELAAPATTFGSPRAFDRNTGNLYVLDPDGNAVWIYEDMQVGEPPRFFFGDDIPPLQDVIDMVVNGDDLYLLHGDGHQTRCTYSTIEGAPTRCEDPLIYTDRREGRQDGAVIPDAVFSQIFFSPPPDPSLYLLDPANQAIYHFGMNLGFQRQYRPILPAAGQKATAFTVATNRVVFLAVGNAVYYAAIP